MFSTKFEDKVVDVNTLVRDFFLNIFRRAAANVKFYFQVEAFSIEILSNPIALTASGLFEINNGTVNKVKVQINLNISARSKEGVVTG